MSNYIYGEAEREYYEGPGQLATEADAVREYTRNVGAENPDQEWILSQYDSWEKNPFFTGTPGRHPEDDRTDEQYAEDEARNAAYMAAHPQGEPDWVKDADPNEIPF